MDKYLSFVVYGDAAKYRDGAIDNARAISKIYPGWKGIFHVDEDSCIDLVPALEGACVEVVLINKKRFPSMVFSRYLPIWTISEGVVLFRDVDSLINIPEREAVEDWLKTGLPFHWMRDHPKHTATVMGGMWGMRLGQYFGDYFDIFMEWAEKESYGSDQVFLEQWLYPTMLSQGVVYSDYMLLPRERRREWPVPRASDQFIGSVVRNSKELTEQLAIERERSVHSKGETPYFYQRKDWTTFYYNFTRSLNQYMRKARERLPW